MIDLKAYEKFSKFDTLLYLANHRRDELIPTTIKSLFPEYTSEDYNDHLFTEFVADQYAYYRSMGMPVVEAAHAIHIPGPLMADFFNGRGLSLECLLYLAKAETYAEAYRKGKHLRTIEQAEGAGSSMRFLEKVYNKEYGERKQIDISTGFSETRDDTWNIEIHHVGNKEKQKSLDEQLEERDAEEETQGLAEDQS